MEARCCTGRQVPMAKAPCSRATSLPWCKTAVTSASCEAIQILFRLDPRQYGASSRESNHSHSNRFMEAGGRRTFSQMQKQQLRNLPNVICERSDRCSGACPHADPFGVRQNTTGILVRCVGNSDRSVFRRQQTERAVCSSIVNSEHHKGIQLCHAREANLENSAIAMKRS